MTDPIRADLLSDITHGFFTRTGGVSAGIYASLNGGQGSKDLPDAVAENRRRVAARLGVDEIVTVHQIHSDRTETIAAPWNARPPEADAMVSATPGLGLSVLTADCAPVLLADSEAGIVGAAHAGWKGALGGVLESVVAAMVRLGASPSRLRAAVGPCISQRAYEVGPEFLERFLDEDPETARFFAGGAGDRSLFDLPGFVLARLRSAGVAAEWTGHCTYGDPARFFSYRRAVHAGDPDYGRLVSSIALPA